jgi:hypothetical protein
VNRTRRAFLRAAVLAPIAATVWVLYEQSESRVKVRTRPVACCLPNGSAGRACTHPAAAPAGGRS